MARPDPATAVPTLGVFYRIAFTTTQAGPAAPLAYLAAFAVCLVPPVSRPRS